MVLIKVLGLVHFIFEQETGGKTGNVAVKEVNRKSDGTKLWRRSQCGPGTPGSCSMVDRISDTSVVGSS